MWSYTFVTEFWIFLKKGETITWTCKLKANDKHVIVFISCKVIIKMGKKGLIDLKKKKM